MSAHFAWLVLPIWVQWLAYLPAAAMAFVLGLAWPAELLIARLRLQSGPGQLGEWPDDYDHLELAQLVDSEYAAAQATGMEALRRLSFP